MAKGQIDGPSQTVILFFLFQNMNVIMDTDLSSQIKQSIIGVKQTLIEAGNVIEECRTRQEEFIATYINFKENSRKFESLNEQVMID